MAVTKKGILNKLYVVFVFITLFLVAIIFKLTNIQFSNGEKYRSLSEQLTLRNDTIFANRGSVFSDDGSLLATSMSQYEIRMDAFTIDGEVFEKNIRNLSVELSKMLGNSTSHWETKIRKARNTKNRYLFIARKLGYTDYMKIKSFPIFNLGMYKGGFIAEQSTVRAHPLGKVAERTIGYDDYRGAPGIEGAYRKYLTGKNGLRMKQKIAKGQWKPINDNNEKEPINGKDIVTTLDVNIQDIAHHSLLRQLEFYDAEHGCVVVMETKTGEIKAISNLGRSSAGKYYEKRNYAVYESHEPGSAFKVMAMVVALESGKIDTSTVVDTGTGRYRMYGRYINDSHRGGYGKISAARALEVSSNIGFARLIEENFGEKPEKFINALKNMNLGNKLGLPIKGEGSPEIPAPGDDKWSKNALPSIAYGYNLTLTPLQTLTFYNAIANNGEMVKPKFIKEIRSWNKHVESFDKVVINPSICSKETINKVQEILKNVVVRGTGSRLYSEDFSMAGKTGTARTEYWMDDWETNRRYISSFTGYFPAENPKYSCIVVIHKPNTKTGFYGADVSGPVFKDIAQKIYTTNHTINEIENKTPDFESVKNDFEKYYAISNKELNSIPNVKGMAAMDAISLLENLGLKVNFSGNGKVVEQSLNEGEKLVKGATINIKLS
ncbi:cell division protein FtsI (penicillin-binding protein 3) [Lutibacter oceani]|uniref:Cell division protein FtsI (Penicillin-binding protein 3) n=1 Tax=Lutibacter oceani TaxID=1853311 RepID=A0A3D9S317_9FLAO|nr:penicillin-binding protein [Lutibacter oceani]REE83032.1 cell division protein FtsI (penicillin-binding protein 3) [Lutibacter oceani]